MRRNPIWSSRIAASSLSALLFVAGCGDSGGNGGSTSNSGGAAGQGGAGGDVGQGGAGGMGMATGGSGGMGTGGSGMSGFAAIVMPSSRVVLEADNAGSLTATCGVLKDGLAYGGAFTSSVTISPSMGVVENAGTFTFAEAGTFTATCTVDVDGQKLTADTTISVLNEALHPLLAKEGAGISGVQNAIHRVIASNGGPDQALKDAITALDTSLVDLDPLTYAGFKDILRKIPGDYPNEAKLIAAGIQKSPDDALLAPRMDAAKVALTALRTTIAAIDPAAPKPADETALQTRKAELEAAITQLNALNITAHGVITNRTTIATFLRDEVAPTVRAMGSLVSAMAKAEAGAIIMAKGDTPISLLHPDKHNFGFLSFTIGMFELNALQSQLINGMYGELIDAADKSINNLILLKAIDYLLPPNPNGPNIEMMYASASMGFALVGYDTWIYGSGFNSDPNFNIFIIIGDGWQTIVDSAWSACGIADANTLPEMVDTVEQCINDVKEAAQNSLPSSPIEIIEPGNLAAQDIHLGPFPPACSSAIPLAIGIIPINLATGRGPTWLTNCIK